MKKTLGFYKHIFQWASCQNQILHYTNLFICCAVLHLFTSLQMSTQQKLYYIVLLIVYLYFLWFATCCCAVLSIFTGKRQLPTTILLLMAKSSQKCYFAVIHQFIVKVVDVVFLGMWILVQKVSSGEHWFKKNLCKTKYLEAFYEKAILIFQDVNYIQKNYLSHVIVLNHAIISNRLTTYWQNPV